MIVPRPWTTPSPWLLLYIPLHIHANMQLLIRSELTHRFRESIRASPNRVVSFNAQRTKLEKAFNWLNRRNAAGLDFFAFECDKRFIYFFNTRLFLGLCWQVSLRNWAVISEILQKKKGKDLLDPASYRPVSSVQQLLTTWHYTVYTLLEKKKEKALAVRLEGYFAWR